MQNPDQIYKNLFNKKLDLYSIYQPFGWNKMTDTGIKHIKHEYALMVDKYLATEDQLAKERQQRVQVEQQCQQLVEKNKHLTELIKKRETPKVKPWFTLATLENIVLYL